MVLEPTDLKIMNNKRFLIYHIELQLWHSSARNNYTCIHYIIMCLLHHLKQIEEIHIKNLIYFIKSNFVVLYRNRKALP